MRRTGRRNRTMRRTRHHKIVTAELRPATEIAVIYYMMILLAVETVIIAGSSAMTAAVPATIRIIMHRTPEIEMSMVRIHLIYPQVTDIVYRIYRAEKVLQCQETGIRHLRKNPAQVVVPLIQEAVIGSQCRCLTAGHSRQVRIDTVQKVKIDLKQIIVLRLVQAQFKSHPVGQKTCIQADVTQSGRRHRQYPYQTNDHT